MSHAKLTSGLKGGDLGINFMTQFAPIGVIRWFLGRIRHRKILGRPFTYLINLTSIISRRVILLAGVNKILNKQVVMNLKDPRLTRFQSSGSPQLFVERLTGFFVGFG